MGVLVVNRFAIGLCVSVEPTPILAKVGYQLLASRGIVNPDTGEPVLYSVQVLGIGLKSR